jgi:hypothetical protein
MNAANKSAIELAEAEIASAQSVVSGAGGITALLSEHNEYWQRFWGG